MGLTLAEDPVPGPDMTVPPEAAHGDGQPDIQTEPHIRPRRQWGTDIAEATAPCPDTAVRAEAGCGEGQPDIHTEPHVRPNRQWGTGPPMYTAAHRHHPSC